MLSNNSMTQPKCHAERNEVESKHLGWEVLAIARFLARLGMTEGCSLMKGYSDE